MSKDVRKALMIAKGQVSSGYLPPGDPQREANLARHMEGSAAPPVMYHGTTRIKSWRSDPGPIDKFQGGRGHPDAPVAAYAAFDPEFAARFANYNPMEKPKNTLKEQGHVYPLHVRATNIFDIVNPKHRELVSLTRHPAKAEERHYKNLPDDKYPWDWHDLEHNTHKIKKAGFDSFYDYETNALSKGPPSGIGVFDPAQIKSAIGNNGTFDPSDPDITKAEGGEVKSRHPALSIPGFHVREEIHGTPIFTGGRNAN